MCFVQYFLIRGLPPRISKTTGFLLIVVFATFSGLRGMVGTDTWQYNHIVGAIGNGTTVALEPGFVFFARVFTSITDNTMLAVNLFSILFFAFASIYLVQATRTEAIYLFAFFAPQSFIMYSFNGLRIGLASITFILALQYWRQEKHLVFLGFLALAVAFQYTILLAITVFFLFNKPLTQRKYVLQRLVILFLVGTVVVLINDYLFGKIESYSNFERMSSLAGLSYLINFTLFMAFIWRIPIPTNEIRSKLYLSFGILLAGLLIATHSYAGLRILNIMVWLVPLLFIYSVENGKSAGPRFHAGLAIVGFVGSLATLRNIAGSTDFSGTPSPFLPYHFMWETSF